MGIVVSVIWVFLIMRLKNDRMGGKVILQNFVAMAKGIWAKEKVAGARCSAPAVLFCSHAHARSIHRDDDFAGVLRAHLRDDVYL